MKRFNLLFLFGIFFSSAAGQAIFQKNLLRFENSALRLPVFRKKIKEPATISRYLINKDGTIQMKKGLIPNDQRSSWEKSRDIELSLAKEQEQRDLRSQNPWLQYQFPELDNNLSYATPAWEEPSKKLIVLIHGLRSSPLAWEHYLDFLQDLPGHSLFAPKVLNKGYTSIEEAADPILQVLKDYKKKFPHNPIHLLGHSHGARISAYLDRCLNVESFLSIAGPHEGLIIDQSPSLDLARSYGVTQRVLQEWKRQSLKSKAHMLENKNNVDRWFIGSADDLTVPNFSSLPMVPGEFILIKRESHVTILDAALYFVVEG